MPGTCRLPGRGDGRGIAGHRGAAAAPSAGEDGNPVCVLIVEDDRSQAMFAESVLGGSGIQARSAAVGRRGWPMRRLPALDLGADGPAHAGHGRHLADPAHPRSTNTSARADRCSLTGDPDPELQSRCSEFGADDFLNKPIRPRHLIAAVQNRIQRARQRADCRPRRQTTGIRRPACCIARN